MPADVVEVEDEDEVEDGEEAEAEAEDEDEEGVKGKALVVEARARVMVDGVEVMGEVVVEDSGVVDLGLTDENSGLWRERGTVILW